MLISFSTQVSHKVMTTVDRPDHLGHSAPTQVLLLRTSANPAFVSASPSPVSFSCLQTHYGTWSTPDFLKLIEALGGHTLCNLSMNYRAQHMSLFVVDLLSKKYSNLEYVHKSILDAKHLGRRGTEDI